MTTMATRTTIPTARSSSRTAAAARLVASKMANQTRSPAIAAPQPASRETGSPATSIPAV
jgi:hypothetical protein